MIMKKLKAFSFISLDIRSNLLLLFLFHSAFLCPKFNLGLHHLFPSLVVAVLNQANLAIFFRSSYLLLFFSYPLHFIILPFYLFVRYPWYVTYKIPVELFYPTYNVHKLCMLSKLFIPDLVFKSHSYHSFPRCSLYDSYFYLFRKYPGFGSIDDSW